MIKTRIFSIGLAVLLLCGLLCIPTGAEADNLFTNPEFAVEDDKVTGWKYYGGASVEDIKSKPSDAPLHLTGNAFSSTTSGEGLQTTAYLKLNENNKSCYLSFWYKSSADNAMNFSFLEYAEEGKDRLVAPNMNCPSTGGKWKCYRVRFTATNDETNVVQVILRINDSEGNANVYFMSPYFSCETPLLNGGEFDGYMEGWSISTKTAQIHESSKIEVTSNANDPERYLQISSNSEQSTSLHVINYTARDFTVNSSKDSAKKYKISFKYKPISAEEGKTCAPRVEVNIGHIGIKTDGTKVYEQGGTGYKFGNLVTLSNTIALGTPSYDGWTQYISYIDVPAKDSVKDKEADKVNSGNTYTYTGENCINFIRAYNENAGTIVAYDDFSVEPVQSEYIIYQNGVETSTIQNGKPVGIRYHNADAENANCIIVRYAIDGDTKTIEDFVLLSSTANAALADEPVHTFTIPETGNYEVAAFAWSDFATLHPVTPAATAKTVSVE